MGGFKFLFQDKAAKFACVNVSIAQPLHLRGHFRGLAANTEQLWGVGSLEGLPRPQGSTSQTHSSFTLRGKG